MRSCSSGWASVIEAITTAGTPTTDCVERAGTADIADSRFESDSDPAQSVFRDLAVPDRQHIVGSPAGNPVLAHERLGRFEHRLAAIDQGLGVILGDPENIGRRSPVGAPGQEVGRPILRCTTAATCPDARTNWRAPTGFWQLGGRWQAVGSGGGSAHDLSPLVPAE